jgi:hypothetical protein
MNFTWKKDGWRLGVLIILAFFYLSPGGGLLLEGRRDKVLSDGTDPAGLPYGYSIVRDLVRENPRHLFYGAIPTDRLNPPEGLPIWLAWNEKLTVAALGQFIPVEQLSTAFLVLIMSLSGICFYFMGRLFGWDRSLSFALAICWAFNAFTRARAKVHMGFAGTYHLPLVLIALHLAIRGQSWRSLAVSTLAFLVAATVPHYFLIITAFIAPLLLILVAIYPEARQSPKRVIGRLVIAALPAVVFVGYSYLKPLPSEVLKQGTVAYPRTGETKSGDAHPFMRQFGARPIDYFTGDIATGGNDLNPARALLNDSVLKNLDGSNAHERSNGIRWLVWLAFGAAIFVLVKQREAVPWSAEVQRRTWFFAGLFGFCFLLSLPPDIFGLPIGPSAWLHKLVSQVRVPSRAGIFAQFALLLVVGEFLQAWLFHREAKKSKREHVPVLWPKVRKFLLLSGTLPFLAIIELPPFLNPMPISPITPARAGLTDGQPCGYGLYFPYISGTYSLLEYYYFLQSMRGSHCKIINAAMETATNRNQWLMQTMPLHEKLYEDLNAKPGLWHARLVRFAQCVPLDWYVFDKKMDPEFIDKVCAALGWTKVAADSCRSPERDRPLQTLPETCWK